jgi:hypothetical protein
MSKQTRLNFSKATTASSKRRKLNSNDETHEQESNDNSLQQPKEAEGPSSEDTNKIELEAPPQKHQTPRLKLHQVPVQRNHDSKPRPTQK